MKVAVVSDFRDGYTVALEACYARALTRLGHDVRVVPIRPESAASGAFSFATARIRARSLASKIAREVLASEASIVLLVKAAGVTASAVRLWRQAGMRVANVFPDNPFDAAAATGLGMGLLDQLRACNRVFVHDRFALGQLRQIGVASDFIAFARDPEVHDRSMVVGDLVECPARIAFVGNPDSERIRFLRAVADLGLAIWGAWAWARLPVDDPLAKCVRGPEQMGREMVRCLSSAVLSVNVLRYSQKTAHNMRSFESPACGVCTLSEASNGVLELFDSGREIAVFRTPEELRRLALELMCDESRRQDICSSGWNRVVNDTYDQRAAQVLDALQSR